MDTDSVKSSDIQRMPWPTAHRAGAPRGHHASAPSPLASALADSSCQHAVAALHPLYSLLALPPGGENRAAIAAAAPTCSHVLSTAPPCLQTGHSFALSPSTLSSHPCPQTHHGKAKSPILPPQDLAGVCPRDGSLWPRPLGHPLRVFDDASGPGVARGCSPRVYGRVSRSPTARCATTEPSSRHRRRRVVSAPTQATPPTQIDAGLDGDHEGGLGFP
jgi:hypothetical protein